MLLRAQFKTYIQFHREMGEKMTVYVIVKNGRIVMIWDTGLAEKNATQLHDFIGWWKDMEPWDEIIKVALSLEKVSKETLDLKRLYPIP